MGFPGTTWRRVLGFIREAFSNNRVESSQGMKARDDCPSG